MIRAMIFIAFIMLLITIILVTIGASIIEEKEREIDEEENREVREVGRLIIKSKEGQNVEVIRHGLDITKVPPGVTITEDDLKNHHIQKKIAESIAWLEEEFTKKRIERQRRTAQECLERKRKERSNGRSSNGYK